MQHNIRHIKRVCDIISPVHSCTQCLMSLVNKTNKQISNKQTHKNSFIIDILIVLRLHSTPASLRCFTKYFNFPQRTIFGISLIYCISFMSPFTHSSHFFIHRALPALENFIVQVQRSSSCS